MKLELRGITKRFGSLIANDSIDLVVEPGEIHALLGENGAGKSTLMNVLYGLYQPDEGQILVDGEPVTFSGPGDAMASGIGMVHQHFMLIPVFTVAENVELGHERTTRFGFLDRKTARREVEEVSQRYGLRVPVDALVQDLPVGVQQRVEIIKALANDAKVLILDEPTAVLTPQEIDELPVQFNGPGDAIAAGIGMVHQHFMLIPVFTVTENIMLGVESTNGPLLALDRDAARQRIVQLSEEHGLRVDPDAYIEDLPVGVRQRV
ncbi:MAG TPA: ATP-binding cassette domain-containing protein, partial [Marmoricola sp.]|nr:ATP-binding cassette domain-containing protein [Marmoricola sp.]